MWLLKSRYAPRTPLAALRIAVEMVEHVMISERDAIARIPINTMLHFQNQEYSLSDVAPDYLDQLQLGGQE